MGSTLIESESLFKTRPIVESFRDLHSYDVLKLAKQVSLLWMLYDLSLVALLAVEMPNDLMIKECFYYISPISVLSLHGRGLRKAYPVQTQNVH